MCVAGNWTLALPIFLGRVPCGHCPARDDLATMVSVSVTASPITTAILPEKSVQPQARLQQIDILRGAIMIIMALDHVRDFFHSSALVFPPENLARTTPAIFFTRWITHFCAPVFMFTAGLGAFLWLQRGRTK